MWKLTANERLNRWREFRKQISELSLEERLVRTVDFWLSCPFIPNYLDPELPDSWPDPWTLISENYYCDLAKSLGMLYTLYLSSSEDMPEYEIRIYKNTKTGFIYNLVYLAQGKYVLNLLDNQVVNNTSLDKNLKLLHSYGSSTLHLEKY